MKGNAQTKSDYPSLGSSPKTSPSSVNPQIPKTEPKEEIEPIDPSHNQNPMINIDQEDPESPSTSENLISPVLKTPEELDPKENRPEVIIYAHKDSIEIEGNENKSKTLILGGWGVGKSTLIDKLLGAEFEEEDDIYVLKEPSNPKYAKIGNLSQGAGTCYPRAYKIDPSLTVVEMTVDESMTMGQRMSSHMLLDLIVRKGIKKIVLVVHFETFKKQTEFISNEMRILEQIINRPDVDVLLAVNRYPVNKKFFRMNEQEQVNYANARILEEGSKIIEGLEAKICWIIEGPLAKYEKLKLRDRLKSGVNSMVNSRMEDLVQRFYKLLEDENIKKALQNDPPFSELEQHIKDMIFIYNFFKFNIQQKENFQYFDVLNDYSIQMLKQKMINLVHIKNEHLVFFGNTSPVLFDFQNYMDQDHFQNILPLFKQYVFRKLYPLETLKKLNTDLSNYLQEHPIVDNSQEINRLTQDNLNIGNEIKNINLSLLNEIITEVENTRTQYDDLHKERDEYLLNIFTSVSSNIYGNVAVFKRYLMKLHQSPFGINININDVSSLRRLKNDYQDLFLNQI